MQGLWLLMPLALLVAGSYALYRKGKRQRK